MTTSTISLERSRALFHDLTNFVKPEPTSTIISHATSKHVAHIESLKEMCNSIRIDNNYMNICRELVKIFFENLNNDLEKSYNLVVDDSSKSIVYPQLEIILLRIMLFPIDVKPFQNNILEYIEINSIIDKGILNIIKKFHTHFDINYNSCKKYKLSEIMINCNMMYSSEYCFKNLKQTLYITFHTCVLKKLEVITSHKEYKSIYNDYSNILEELVKFGNFACTTYDKYERCKELELLQKENEALKKNLKRIAEIEELKELVDQEFESI
jgi:hypothetical protein